MPCALCTSLQPVRWKWNIHFWWAINIFIWSVSPQKVKSLELLIECSRSVLDLFWTVDRLSITMTDIEIAHDLAAPNFVFIRFHSTHKQREIKCNKLFKGAPIFRTASKIKCPMWEMIWDRCLCDWSESTHKCSIHCFTSFHFVVISRCCCFYPSCCTHSFVYVRCCCCGEHGIECPLMNGRQLHRMMFILAILMHATNWKFFSFMQAIICCNNVDLLLSA